MTHESNSLPSSRELTLDMLNYVQLEPGDVITGLLDAEAINEMELAICEKMTGKRSFTVPSSSDPDKRWHPLADDLRPKGFNGKLGNATALVLPDTHPAIYKPKWSYSTEQVWDKGAVTKLLVSAQMYSRGRGWIGSTSRIVTYSEHATDPSQGRVKDGVTVDTYVLRRHKQTMKSAQAEAAIRSLNWEAAAVARVIGMLALQAPQYSAGLPTLGKNR